MSMCTSRRLGGAIALLVVVVSSLHTRGHNETTHDEWLIFDQVVIGAK